MLMLDNHGAVRDDRGIGAMRAGLMKALDIGALWEACASLVTRVLPCHSCSLMFDIDGYEPQQGRHYLVETHGDHAQPVTSLDVAAPYLSANPQVRWYTFSQIVSQDALAAARLRAQNPAPGWREFIHLAFWNGKRLEAVLSIRIRAEHAVSDHELAFLGDLYPILEAGLQRVRSLEAERVKHKAFEALLYRLPLATTIIDESMNCLYASQEARRILSRWAPATWNASGRRLPAMVESVLRPHLAAACAPGMAEAEALANIAIEHPHAAGLRMQVEISAPLRLAANRTHFILTLVPFAHGSATDAEAVPDASVLPLLQRLSPSERKVALLVAQGMRNDAVARKLFRSRKTVESQLSSIFRKLNVENRAQLVRLLT